MESDQKIIVGISVGDLNGIGGEIIVKTFQDARILDFCTPVIFASASLVSYWTKHFNCPIRFNGIRDGGQIVHGKVNVVNVWKEKVELNFGQENDIGGRYALQSLQAAVKALKNNTVDVLLTAPINKHNIQTEAFAFPGHTDYLAKELEGESLMFMVADRLRVGLLTDHVPVKEVPEHITPDRIKSKLELAMRSLIQDFRILKPKIAVLGINPHSGDQGVIGDEDDKVLRPTLQQMRDAGHLIFGPYSADSFFGSNAYTRFDAIIASYHDQGLIPFKTLAFGKGVNFTAGLKRVRTSPDHGTAYEIAGKGLADNSSFKEALFLAIEVYRNRMEYRRLSAQPLQKQAT